jgi:hypothetical protein
MNDRAQGVDNATLKLGMLMESAQAHQQLAETHLERLRAHTRDLDGVVRDEIRRTLVEELRLLTAETGRATEALRKIRRGTGVRVGLWSVAIALLCTGIPIAILRWALPSASDIATLRTRRDELAANVASLERRGGRIEWRQCGEKLRLCVRVDRKAPIYGEMADYYVVAGY